jgi:hypothetical protein
MAKLHVVKEGEHLSSIAATYGFCNFAPIWNASENEPLRALRQDPHQLLPGDQVVIPDDRGVTFVRPAGQSHTFSVHVEKLKLRLRILDLAGKPAAAQAGKLSLGETTTAVTTDGNGVITADLPRDCQSGSLEIGGAQYHLVVGTLAPISEPSGLAGRLLNCGYWYGDDCDRNDARTLELAIELYQSENGLAITGTVDEALIDKLSQTHDGKG